MPNAYADIAFTPRVREEQRRFGSADAYARVLSPERDDGSELGPREAAFLSARDGLFQATVSETGWPYVQFRGGAPGFLKVIDKRTIGYADYRGNRQNISVGNLRHYDRVSTIAVDYARRERLKLWGHARINQDADVLDLLNGADGPRAERGIVIRIVAFDWNCPKHIPIRLTDAERANEIARLCDRIASLERELARKTSPSANRAPE
ncbi:pyridoxamine 5'-phosphate oxidase family protein [Roseovarius sp.]|uniref:pyridoxamine 5'-phosphate oxidase family protein n=1 Tax=Roseovarius sp. TaxID=1486281 RepID=UPI003D0B445B